jgi:GPH family glycoside/pentoside/hexuronide:cation symporter
MVENNINSREKLSKRKLIGYAIGAIPTALLAGVFLLIYVDFFYDDLKLIWEFFIMGQVIYLIVNAINDPLLGQLSDKTNRKKWGSRRIVYIKFGAPIWALIFIMIWFPWSYTNQIIIFIHFVISICAFDTMLTLIVLCWMALLPEMTSNIDQRNKANFFVNIFGFFGAVPVIVIQLLKGYGLIAFQIGNIIVAVMSIVCLEIVALSCKESPEFQKDETFPIKKSIKRTVKSKSFMLYIGFNFCQVFNRSIGLTYLFTYIIILGNNTAAIIGYFLVYVIIGFSSNYLCVKLRPKWGIKKVILRFGILGVIGSAIMFFLILNPILEPLIWIGFAWSAFFGGYSVYNYPLMTLSMDEDEIRHGVRREGMFLGMNALFTKPAESLGPIIATFILEYFGYIRDTPIQSASAIVGIKILFLLVPTIFIGVGLIFMYFYPLHGDKFNELKNELERLHKRKRADLVENKSNKVNNLK